MTAVVIVNWNGRRLLDACLEEVFAQTMPPEIVIVVDNASTDGSVEHLRERWPGVRIMPLVWNSGIAAGNNAGIRAAVAAGARYVLLLNNDAYLHSSALAELLSALDDAGASAWAAAPKTLYRREPGRIWSAGGTFEWWRGLSRDRGTDELDCGQYDQPGHIDFANACCLLVRAETFERIGLMDEAYFMYYDDSDFSARLRRAGGLIRYVPSARVLHDVQGSSGRDGRRASPLALYYTTRNRRRFIQRNAPSTLHRLVAHTFTIMTRVIRIGQALVGGRWGEGRLVGEALIDAYLLGQTGPTRRRLLF